MADYNSQSIDIDLEEMFNNLSDEDQEEFLVDMFRNLSDEDIRKNVVKDNMFYIDNDTTIDIIANAFWSMSSSDQKDTAERIADVMTPEQREAFIEYIKGI
jgi:hypothetical protein